MTADRTRVSSYLSPALVQKLVQFQQERGLKSMSQSLTTVLEEYFGLSATIAVAPDRLLSLENQLSQLTEEITELKQVLAPDAAGAVPAPSVAESVKFEEQLFQTWQKLARLTKGPEDYWSHPIALDAIARTGFPSMALQQFFDTLATVQSSQLELITGLVQNHWVGQQQVWALTFHAPSPE